MKAYVKPAMTALSISANDMLCSGSCKVQTRFDKDLSSKLEGFFPGSNNDGVFTPEEAGNAFASTESCTEKFDYNNYCKYTASEAGQTQLFTS